VRRTGRIGATDGVAPAVRRPSMGGGDGDVGEGDGVHDGGADPPRPALRQMKGAEPTRSHEGPHLSRRDRFIPGGVIG